jgi:hypothetical protein
MVWRLFDARAASRFFAVLAFSPLCIARMAAICIEEARAVWLVGCFVAG